MDPNNWDIGQFVYRTSLLLLYPTLVLLALSFLRVIWLLGETVHDAWPGRGRRHGEAGRQLRDLAPGAGDTVAVLLASVADSRRQHPQLRRFVRQLLDELDRGPRETLAARADHLAAEIEAELARDVNGVRVLVRIGPCLGLAGTLIPLGPGLMALSEGDLGRLSAQLVVAFSTTVVGLLVGGVSYVIAMARAHTADLVVGDIELVSDLVRTHLGVQPAQRAACQPARLETEGVSA